MQMKTKTTAAHPLFLQRYSKPLKAEKQFKAAANRSLFFKTLNWKQEAVRQIFAQDHFKL